MVSKQQRKVGFKSNLNRREKKKAFLAAVSTVAEEGKSVKILTALFLANVRKGERKSSVLFLFC